MGFNASGGIDMAFHAFPITNPLKTELMGTLLRFISEFYVCPIGFDYKMKAKATGWSYKRLKKSSMAPGCAEWISMIFKANAHGAR